jgi:hypothetical protein
MFFSLTRACLLIAVVAIIANAQCYGTCAIVTCGSAETPSGSGHHSKSSHPGDTGFRIIAANGCSTT